MPILYDDECRFCRAALALVLAWDRRHRLRPVAIQSEEGASLLAHMPEAERLESAHAVLAGAAGVRSGGAAAAPVLEVLPGGAPLARVARRFPGLADRSYSWVASNRVSLSRLVPAAIKDRADALVRERGPAAPHGTDGFPSP